MNIIHGDYFDGKQSRRVAAELRAIGELVSVCADGRDLQPPTPLHQVAVSARIGDTPRFLRFADGAKFETRDNAGVDTLLNGRRRGHGLLHHLESRLRYVAVGVVTVAAFSFALMQYGIPAFAEHVAFALPAEASQYMDREVLEMMDKHLLAPTKLAPEEQARLRARFAPVMERVDPRYRVHVEFRSAANTIGPNALALPSGTIVFTDELVRLAGSDDELVAVLAHEIGHVVGRHGLRQVIQGSVLSAAVVVIVGDVSSVSSMITALPVMLTELGYSRDFEREADGHAVKTLQEHGMPVEAFTALLERLDRHLRCEEAGEEKTCEDHANEPRWSSYLSTHPPTAERMQWAREMAEGTRS